VSEPGVAGWGGRRLVAGSWFVPFPALDISLDA